MKDKSTRLAIFDMWRLSKMLLDRELLFVDLRKAFSSIPQTAKGSTVAGTWCAWRQSCLIIPLEDLERTLRQDSKEEPHFSINTGVNQENEYK